MYATVRTADRQGLSRDKELTVAIAKVNPNYVSFLMDNFLNWKIAYYDSVEAAFQAVADCEADAGLLNSGFVSAIAACCPKCSMSKAAREAKCITRSVS